MSRMVSILTIQFKPLKDITAYELHEAYSQLALRPEPTTQDRDKRMIHSDDWGKLGEELRRHFTVLKVEHIMELSEEEKQEKHKAQIRDKTKEVTAMMKIEELRAQASLAGSRREVPVAELRMLQEQMELVYRRVQEEEAKKKAEAIDSKFWTGR